jgi:hypothetical protein
LATKWAEKLAAKLAAKSAAQSTTQTAEQSAAESEAQTAEQLAAESKALLAAESAAQLAAESEALLATHSAAELCQQLRESIVDFLEQTRLEVQLHYAFFQFNHDQRVFRENANRLVALKTSQEMRYNKNLRYTETHYNENDEAKWELIAELGEHNVSFHIGF